MEFIHSEMAGIRIVSTRVVLSGDGDKRLQRMLSILLKDTTGRSILLASVRGLHDNVPALRCKKDKEDG